MNVNLLVARKVKDLIFREEHITVHRLNPQALMYTPCNPCQLMNIKDFVFHVEVEENILKNSRLRLRHSTSIWSYLLKRYNAQHQSWSKKSCVLKRPQESF